MCARNPFWKGDKPAAIEPLSESAAAAIIKTKSTTSSEAVQLKSRTARSKSYIDILQRLYTQIDDLVDDVARGSDPPAKRAEVLKSIAKTLPLLQAAEQAATMKVKDKDLTQLTDEELETRVKRELSNSPSRAQRSPLVPTHSEKNQNRDTDVGLTPTFSEDEE